jgi:hypothetical protein
MKFGKGFDERDTWMRIMHGMFLRKYVSTTDALYIPTVITSIEEVTDISIPEVAATWNDLRSMADDVPTKGLVSVTIDGVRRNAHAVMLDELYGVLLHGDWERRQRSKNLGVAEFALWAWLIDVESLVVAVKGFWELAVREGLVKTA